MKMFLAIVLFTSVSLAQLIQAPITPPTLSTAQAQAKLSRDIGFSANGLYKQEMAALAAGFTSIWSNSDGLTPIQAFQAFGTSQCSVHEAFLEEVRHLNALLAGSVTLSEPKVVTETGSGTACVISIAP